MPGRMEGGSRGGEGEAENYEVAEGRDWAGVAVDRLRGAEAAEAGDSVDMAHAAGGLVGGLRHVLQLQHHGCCYGVPVLGLGSPAEHHLCQHLAPAAVPLRRSLESSGPVRGGGEARAKAPQQRCVPRDFRVTI
jgi:hypothetical protein